VTADDLEMTVYLGERARAGRVFVADALTDLCAADPAVTAVVLRGAAGFGPRHEPRSDLSLSMSEDPPIAVVAVGGAERVAALADRAAEIVPRGTLTLARVRSGQPALPPVGHVELSVFTGRGQRVLGGPAHVAVCAELRRRGFDAAASFLGVDGVIGGARCRAEFFGGNTGVPALTVATGPTSSAAEAVAALRALLPSALITVAPVQLCKRRGVLVSRPAAVAPTDAHGMARWLKLTVHTSEADLHGGRPAHRGLIRRLAEAPATAGVTSIRGIWGFSGDAEPHGDKLFQVGRHVPVRTEYVDTPERVAANFDVVDEFTGRHGVVTCTVVPAVVSVDAGRRRGGTRLAVAPDM
jgi:PII-like signaling protein